MDGSSIPKIRRNGAINLWHVVVDVIVVKHQSPKAKKKKYGTRKWWGQQETKTHTHTHTHTYAQHTTKWNESHKRVKKVLYVVCFNVFYTCFLFTKKSSCYFDTHFSHPLFVLAAFAAAIVVCGVFVVVVVVGGLGLGLGGFGGFGAVFFFFFPSSPLLWL